MARYTLLIIALSVLAAVITAESDRQEIVKNIHTGHHDSKGEVIVEPLVEVRGHRRRVNKGHSHHRGRPNNGDHPRDDDVTHGHHRGHMHSRILAKDKQGSVHANGDKSHALPVQLRPSAHSGKAHTPSKSVVPDMTYTLESKNWDSKTRHHASDSPEFVPLENHRMSATHHRGTTGRGHHAMHGSAHHGMHHNGNGHHGMSEGDHHRMNVHPRPNQDSHHDRHGGMHDPKVWQDMLEHHQRMHGNVLAAPNQATHHDRHGGTHEAKLGQAMLQHHQRMPHGKVHQGMNRNGHHGMMENSRHGSHGTDNTHRQVKHHMARPLVHVFRSHAGSRDAETKHEVA